MKRNAQWGFFAILLSAVLASGQIGATTIRLPQDTVLATVDVGNFPIALPDTVRGLPLPNGAPVQLPASFLADWPGDNTPRAVVFGRLAAPPPLPAVPKSEGPKVATAVASSHPSLSEGEMAVWKSNGEPENWLFRMQFAKASMFEAHEPSPLIPIPEPGTGVLVLIGLAGRAFWSKCNGR